MSIPTYEPQSFVAGETLQWTKELTDYSPSDGWALKYYFQGADRFTVDAVDAGTYFEITVARDTTRTVQAGTYYWQAFVTKDDETHLVDSGQVTMKPSLLNEEGSTAFDGRSTAKQILDAIDAMLKGKATLDQQEYQIGNRMLKRIPIPDLIALRTQYAQLYAREQRTEKLNQGAPFFKTILTRFVRPR